MMTLFHIIYCQNITLDDIKINNAHSDAIDVDISKNITIKNSIFVNPKNDSFGFYGVSSKSY